MMTKKIISVLFAIILMLGMSTVSFAAGEVEFDLMVVDYPDILTDEEEDELNTRAWHLTQKYNCAVYLLITDNCEGYEIAEYNDLLHAELSLGYGEEKSAVILLLAMDDRQYDLMAHGYGNVVFTDYNKDVMAESFLDDFADDSWYSGFNDYLDTCEEYFELAVNGEPSDADSDDGGEIFLGILIATAVSCVIAFIVCLIFRAQMKTARKATEAHKYAKQLNITNQYDRFSHRDIRRIYNPPQDNNSSGGTTINSSGSSHKSGSF